MKVRLLNDGGFGPAMSDIKFPAIVDAEYDGLQPEAVMVSIEELIRLGGHDASIRGAKLPELTFLPGEFEVVDEK